MAPTDIEETVSDPAAWAVSTVVLLEHVARTAGRGLAGVLADEELRRAELLVLLELRAAKDVPQRELVRTTSLDPGDVARTVGGLEERGLVERKSDKTDGRRRSVRLSRKGQRTADRVAKAISKAEGDVLGELSERQRGDLLKLLRKLA